MLFLKNKDSAVEWFRKNPFSKISFILIVIIYIWVSFNVRLWRKDKTIIYWDAISYYAYLPANFIYHDLSLKFMDDYKGKHHFIFWPEKLKNGNYLIKTTMGLSILNLPFFGVAHAYASYFGYDNGGFSKPYRAALLFGTLFWLFIGLIFLLKLLLPFFGDKIASLIILLVSLGTNLYYYVLFEPVMAHQYNFALFSVFLFFTVQWHEKKTVWSAVFIGLSAGFISLIRPTDILIALVFLLYGIVKVRDFKTHFWELLKFYRHILVIVIFAFLVWMPQLIYWKYISGHYLFFSYTDNEHFFWNHPHIIEGIIGYRKGWLLYTPLMIFSIVGIFLLKSRSKNFLLPFLIFLPLNIYIIFSWWSWWYGGSFGSRPMIESYAFLSIALGAFLKWLLSQRQIVKIPVFVLVVFFAAYNLFATQQYRHSAIHWDGMTKEAYWDSFGRLYPSKNLQNLIKRPDYEAAKRGEDKYQEMNN